VTTESLAIPGLVIPGSKIEEAGHGLPKHCVLIGRVNDRTGADGKHYAIGFEMRLPVEWSRRPRSIARSLKGFVPLRLLTAP